MTVEIRRARAQDLACLPDVERQAAMLFDTVRQQTGLSDDLLAAVTPAAAFAAAAEAGRLWVAASPQGTLGDTVAGSPEGTVGGPVVGFVLVSEAGGYAHVEELDVLPSHARRGIGSALLAAVCAWAAEAGYPGVTLRTFLDVPWNAPFYAGRGFEIVASHQLSAAHVELERAEQQRGLRIDLRVSMRYRSATSEPFRNNRLQRVATLDHLMPPDWACTCPAALTAATALSPSPFPLAP